MSILLTDLNIKNKFVDLQLLVKNNRNTYYFPHRVNFSKNFGRFPLTFAKGKRAKV